MTRPPPHDCPHCDCTYDIDDDVGQINRDAPGYRLVALIDALTRPEHMRSRDWAEPQI